LRERENLRASKEFQCEKHRGKLLLSKVLNQTTRQSKNAVSVGKKLRLSEPVQFQGQKRHESAIQTLCSDKVPCKKTDDSLVLPENPKMSSIQREKSGELQSLQKQSF
jgi:hypothetical protein